MSQHKHFKAVASIAMAASLLLSTAAYAAETDESEYGPIPDWVTSFTVDGPNVQVISGDHPNQVDAQTHFTNETEPDDALSSDNDIPDDFSYDLDTFAAQLLQLTNEAREENGLPPLKTNPILSQMAQQRMDESEGRHTRPDGTGFYTIFDEYKTSLKPTGENIAGAAGTPENMVKGWLQSEGHRANLLNPNATHIGIGVSWSETVIGPRIAGLQLFAK